MPTIFKGFDLDDENATLPPSDNQTIARGFEPNQILHSATTNYYLKQALGGCNANALLLTMPDNGTHTFTIPDSQATMSSISHEPIYFYIAGTGLTSILLSTKADASDVKLLNFPLGFRTFIYNPLTTDVLITDDTKTGFSYTLTAKSTVGIRRVAETSLGFIVESESHAAGGSPTPPTDSIKVIILDEFNINYPIGSSFITITEAVKPPYQGEMYKGKAITWEEIVGARGRLMMISDGGTGDWSGTIGTFAGTLETTDIPTIENLPPHIHASQPYVVKLDEDPSNPTVTMIGPVHGFLRSDNERAVKYVTDYTPSKDAIIKGISLKDIKRFYVRMWIRTA